MAVYLGSNQVDMLGGGGGSSDFSTATVTVVVTGSASATINMATTQSGGGYELSTGSIGVDSSYAPALTAILYKGKAACEIVPQSGFSITVSVSGDIQSMGGNFYLITGDGIITIS